MTEDYKKRLIYLPIEPYVERYTEYNSVSNGCYEQTFRKFQIPFAPIRPDEHLRTIKTGLVLDAYERTKWGFAQVDALLWHMQTGNLNPKDDVIFIEDFWQPGFEMIPYMQHMLFGDDVENHIPVYSFCHAQSTDPHDFTRPMSWWMRPLELGWSRYQMKIFCSAPEMISQWVEGELPSSKLVPVGHMFEPATIQALTRCPRPTPGSQRSNIVVFSARFDREKNPLFFVDVAERILQQRHDLTFVMCSSAPELRSNEPAIVEALKAFEALHPKHFVIRTGLTKEAYFKILSHAKVQFNCASQDFVSYTLLESTMYGCAPLYPNYLTFPGALNNSEENLYAAGNVSDAAIKLMHLLDTPTKDYDWVWKKHELTGQRMLSEMGFNVAPTTRIEHLNQMSVKQLKGKLNE